MSCMNLSSLIAVLSNVPILTDIDPERQDDDARLVLALNT